MINLRSASTLGSFFAVALFCGHTAKGVPLRFTYPSGVVEAGNFTSRFEIASIKPSDPHQRIQIINALLTYPGGRLVARGATFQYLLMAAFGLQSFQITGGPKWIDEDRFEIEAKPPAEVAARYSQLTNIKNPPPDEIKVMLQNLLLERFQLRMHFDKHEGRVYKLTKGHASLRLTRSKDAREYPWAGSIEGGSPNGDGLRGINIDMPAFAERISSWLATPVVDQTGIVGAYNFEAVVDNGNENSALDVQNNIIESVKELGLHLQEGRGLVLRLVIDQVALPTPN